MKEGALNASFFLDPEKTTKRVTGKIGNYYQLYDAYNLRKTDGIPFPKADSQQNPSHQFRYPNNDENPYLNTNDQPPYNSSDQLPYPMSDQPMTDLLCERSDNIPTDSNTVHGWNMEFLGGWEIEYVLHN